MPERASDRDSADESAIVRVSAAVSGSGEEQRVTLEFRGKADITTKLKVANDHVIHGLASGKYPAAASKRIFIRIPERGEYPWKRNMTEADLDEFDGRQKILGQISEAVTDFTADELSQILKNIWEITEKKE